MQTCCCCHISNWLRNNFIKTLPASAGEAKLLECMPDTYNQPKHCSMGPTNAAAAAESASSLSPVFAAAATATTAAATATAFAGCCCCY
jgi:hypothetical protein